MQPVQLQEALRAAGEDDTEIVPKSDPRSSVISIDPERMSGTPCFVGSRVPIKHLFDYLVAGESLDDFLEGFPGITREQCITVLTMAYDRLLEGLPKP